MISRYILFLFLKEKQKKKKKKKKKKTCCGYSLEVQNWDSSNEYTHCEFSGRNKKISIIISWQCLMLSYDVAVLILPVSCRLLKNDELNPIFFRLPRTSIALLTEFFELKASECPLRSCNSLYFNLKCRRIVNVLYLVILCISTYNTEGKLKTMLTSFW